MKSLSLSKPHIIVVVGVPGSGKSFFAEKFADTFNAPYVNCGKITTLIADETAASAVIQIQLDELLKTKQSIIIDGLADTKVGRLELTQKARSSGYETLLVWVQTDPATAKSRAMKDKKQNETNYFAALQRFSPPAAIEKPVVISGKHTYASQAKVILKKLSSPRAQISTHSPPPARTEQPGRRNITIR